MLIEDFQPREVEWCEVCRAHVSGECDGCHTRFEATDQRYRSQSHHFHPGAVAGVAAVLAIHKELCVDCYRADHAAVYHAEAPTLPDRGMDPHFFWRAQLQKRRDAYLSLIVKSSLGAEEQKKLEELVALVK